MRGKLTIIAILLVAVTTAGFAWWWNYNRAVKVRNFWGDAAAPIRFAQKIEACKLGAPIDSKDTLSLHGKAFGVEQKVDISKAPGLLNARTSLMVDESFDWSHEPQPADPKAAWSHGVRFTHANKTATILFDFEGQQLALVESGQAVPLSSKTASGWKSYLDRVFQNAVSSKSE